MTAPNSSSVRVPYATCPVDDEPLVATFERPYKEFLCMACGNWWAFLEPKPAAATPELDDRYAELVARYDAGERPP